MKIYSIIYLVQDGLGQRAFAVCEDSSDTIQICGLQNEVDENVYFESDAYYLEDWCNGHGFEYKCVEKTYDFGKLWNQSIKI